MVYLWVKASKSRTWSRSLAWVIARPLAHQWEQMATWIVMQVAASRSMIGSLLYVTASRSDVMFSVCMCARFQASPRESHLKATKRILRYLKHTPVGLWYPKGAKFELVGYSNSDYVGCKVERKSTSGTCQLLGRSHISWSSKRQNSVALSTAKAEYISAGSCCAQILWMKATFSDFRIKFKIVPLLCDMRVQSSSPIIRFNMQEQSILMSATIS